MQTATPDEIFGSVFFRVFGWKHTDFVFVQDSWIPFSSVPSVAITVVIYLSLIFLGKNFMSSRKPLSLKPLFAIHNALLSFVSLVLVILLLEVILPKLFANGLHWTMCSGDMFNDKRLELLYYINYLVKYYELTDTVFLVLCKKPLAFLHVYHHTLTLILCYTQLVGNTAVQWVPILLNLMVHVLMYYYYARTAFGAKLWWKQYLTTLQIVQFILDLIAVYYCTTVHFVAKAGRTTLDCHGGEPAAFFGCALLSSYLVLFIQFFQKTYHDRKSQSQSGDSKKKN